MLMLSRALLSLTFSWTRSHAIALRICQTLQYTHVMEFHFWGCGVDHSKEPQRPNMPQRQAFAKCLFDDTASLSSAVILNHDRSLLAK
jgi:hypothetical protein